MKFGQTLCAVWQKFLTCFWLNAGDWKLVPDHFMILLKLQYNEICSFLIVDILPFLIIPDSPFQKSETLEP